VFFFYGHQTSITGMNLLLPLAAYELHHSQPKALSTSMEEPHLDRSTTLLHQ